MSILRAGLVASMLVGLACSSNCDASVPWLFVPVVGPFVAAHETDRGSAKNLALMDGVVQAAGAGVVLAGAIVYLATPAHLVPNDTMRGSLTFTPLLARGTSGLALGGTF